MRTKQMLLAAAAVLLASVQGRAATSTQEDSFAPNYVGDHRFSPSYLILSPFAAPSVATGVLIGSMHPSVPGVSENLDVVGLTPSVFGQIPIVEHLTIPIRVTGLVIAGTNAVSAINFGATAGYQIETGLEYQALTTSQLVLTGAVTVAKPHLYSVSPLVSVQQALRGLLNGAPTNLDFATQSTLWYPSVRAAWGLSPIFGLQGSLGAEFYSSEQDEDSRSQLALVLSLDTQLKPALGVPLALSLIYGRNQVLTQAGSQNSDTYAFSLFETLSPRFNFGAEAGWIRVADRTVFTIGVLGRYYYASTGFRVGRG